MKTHTNSGDFTGAALEFPTANHLPVILKSTNTEPRFKIFQFLNNIFGLRSNLLNHKRLPEYSNKHFLPN
jgi:hypothetical protein